MATKTETQARRLVRALYAATEGRPMQYRMLVEISDVAGTEAAVQLAVEKGWLLCERGHSVCLTDDGRRLAQRAG